MTEWAHPIAIGVGLLYTLGGLAKFVGLKDFYVSIICIFVRLKSDSIFVVNSHMSHVGK